MDEKCAPFMKICYYIATAAAALCLVLSIVLFWEGGVNQGLQTDVQGVQVKLQQQQEEINKGNAISQQVGPALLRDMAVVSTKDEAMKKLLATHGYEIKVATPAPGSSPAPGAAAPKTAPSGTPAAATEPGRLQP
jgi:hypothetical protein